MALLLALMLTVRKKATALGAAASLIMFLSACGWIIQVIKTPGNASEHSGPAFKALTALGCLILAMTGVALRIAKMNLNLAFAERDETNLNLETQRDSHLDSPPKTDNVITRTVHIPTHTTQSEKTYHSLNQMPPELREQVEQMIKKHGGSTENIGLIPIHDTHIDITEDKYVVTDNLTGEKQTYTRKEDLPAHVRQMLDQTP